MDTPGNNQPPNSDPRIAILEAYSALFLRLVLCLLGVVLIFYEAILAQGDDAKVRIVFTLVGAAMTGPVVAASTATMLQALRGGKP